jgi:hypothetical protein
MLSFIERGSGFPCPSHPVVAVGLWYPMLSSDGTSLLANKSSWSICFRNDKEKTACPVVTRAAAKKYKNRIIRLICPFLPPRIFVKCPSIRKMDGRGGGDRTTPFCAIVVQCSFQMTAYRFPVMASFIRHRLHRCRLFGVRIPRTKVYELVIQTRDETMSRQKVCTFLQSTSADAKMAISLHRLANLPTIPRPQVR